MKKWLGILLLTILMCGMHVSAAVEEDTVVALGADLSAAQRATVLELMGLTEDDLASCTVITITNAQEHQYLDAYLDASVIGTKSLTSVKMTKVAKGEGIHVTTKNVNYCTTGMYRNALITAGVEDMDVFVVAPTPISGTAGLIGAIKSYEKAENTTVSEKVIDTALDELITTGEIEKTAEKIEDEDLEALMEWLKVKLASGELDTSNEESVRATIEAGEKEFGVVLSDSEKQQIISILKKLDSIGLNGEYLFGEAQKLMSKYGSGILEHTGEAIQEVIGDANEAINEAAREAAHGAVKDFFHRVGESVKGVFSKLLKK